MQPRKDVIGAYRGNDSGKVYKVVCLVRQVSFQSADGKPAQVLDGAKSYSTECGLPLTGKEDALHIPGGEAITRI